MLEVKLTGQCGCMATRTGRYGNQAVAGAASEAFVRWLLHRYTRRRAYRFAVRYVVNKDFTVHSLLNFT